MYFGILLSAIFIGVIAIGAGVIVYTSRKAGGFKLNPLGAAIAIIGIVGAVLVPSSFHTVEAGQVAVVKHLGEAVKKKCHL